MITREQFVENYKDSLESHDKRVGEVVEAKRIAQAYMLLLGGNFECHSQNINVMSLPNDRNRYFTDDELIEITTRDS